VSGYARKFAKIGIADAFVESLKDGLSSPSLVSATIALKAIAVNVLNSGFAVVAAAATGNEVIKESFVELHIDELMVNVTRKHGKGSIPSLYDAIRVLLAADDNRVVASQVSGYARKFAKIGIADALVESLKDGLSSPSLVSATIALKAIAVNQPVFDELKELLGELLCVGDQGNVKGVAPEMGESVAENGGIDSLLVCIDDAGVQGHRATTLWLKLAAPYYRSYYTLLVTRSDFNKSAIVERGGLNRLITLSSRLADDPFVIQEGPGDTEPRGFRRVNNKCLGPVFLGLGLTCNDYHMYTLLAIARKLAIEAGAGDLAIQSMQKFPEAYQLQKNSCLVIHNLVARNLENKSIFHCVLRALLVCLLIISFGFYNISLSLHMTLLLGKGIEKIIRKAKDNHKSCKDAGLDNYNS
ncbi:armadillo repeat-containing protein 6, partial [Tanacetum coccineum]